MPHSILSALPILFLLVVVQSLNHVQLFVTPWIAARQASLSFTISQALFKLMSIESIVPSSHLILCRPLLLLPSVFPASDQYLNQELPDVQAGFRKGRRTRAQIASVCWSIEKARELFLLVFTTVSYCRFCDYPS